MKLKLGLVPALLVFVLSLTSLAAPKRNSATVRFTEPVTVASTQLKPGTYRLTWEGVGPDVQVSFLKGKKTVATVPATLVDEASPYSGAVDTKMTSDNSRVLEEIQWKKMALRFDETGSGGGN
jgi:hypothetical protein